jgi:hypothetical protein
MTASFDVPGQHRQQPNMSNDTLVNKPIGALNKPVMQALACAALELAVVICAGIQAQEAHQAESSTPNKVTNRS